MVTKVTIQGFKSLQDVPDLELGQVNVFIGANGSGKTNLLEALGVLSAAAWGRVDDSSLLWRGVRPGVPALYKTSLADTPLRRSITFQATGEWDDGSARYKVSLDNSNEGKGAVWNYVTESLFRGTKKIVAFSPRGKSFVFGSLDLRPEVFNPHFGGVAFLIDFEDMKGAPAELIQRLSDYAIFSPITPVLRGIVPDIEQHDPLGLSGGRLPEAIEDLLKPEENRFGNMDLGEVLDLLDWASDFDITAPSRQLLSPSIPALRQVIRFTDRRMRRGRNQLSAYDASEGALYMLFMLTLAIHPRTPPLFAIDNFDQAMHPRLARAVARLFCRQMVQSTPPRQALLTTHNPLVLDGLDLRDDRIRLFAVDRNSQGATQVRRVQVSEEVLRATQEGLSLSNLWVMGRLGGVPDLF